MSRPDLNLLFTLDAVLAEGSVARAARKLNLSPSAMSRALARLREVTGDPLLVRAGRGLVPTPRALELREHVGRLVQESESVLRPAEKPDLSKVKRTFTIRTGEGFPENFGPGLIGRLGSEAPGVGIHFLQKPDKDSAPLRAGTIDLETGVIEESMGPEIRAQALFEDRFVGVVRAGHPLSDVRVTSNRYAAGRHVRFSRRTDDKGLIDDALRAAGIERDVAVTVAGFATALALARSSDLIATVPEKHTGILREGMHTFALPFKTPKVTVMLLWHPRLDADPVHRWLRGVIREICAAV